MKHISIRQIDCSSILHDNFTSLAFDMPKIGPRKRDGTRFMLINT
jgi:hypothetical protein